MTGSLREITKASIDGNTVFLPSDTTKLSRLFCGETPKTSSLADIHDAGRFAEDFVLCDHVGVPSSMFHYIGPHLVDLRSWDDFPLLDLFGVTRELYMVGHQHQKIAEQLKSLAPDRGGDDDFSESDRERVTEERGRLLEEMTIAFSALEAWIRLEKVGEQAHAVGSSTSESATDASNDDVYSDNLASIFRWAGLSASPGWRYREEFAARHLTPERFLYDAVAERFAADTKSVQAWQSEQQIVVPPILAILVARAGSSKFLLSELIGLRDEFSEMRSTSRRYRSSLVDANSIHEKLSIIRDMEAARDALIRKLSATPRTSTVQRLWNIVKGFTLSSAFVRFTDMF